MSRQQAESTPAVDLPIEGISDAVMIGRGSFGVVYRANQAAYRRVVAVKVLSEPLLDEDARRRFDRECQALGSLSGHPNIVTLHSAGITPDGHPYLIMDHLPGGTLAERVAREGRIGWEEAVDIGVKLCGALAEAHSIQILHRDVKPENILVSRYGEPQLVDFGVARVGGSATATATSTGSITGSLAHASPEALSGVPASETSDVWSLASTISTLVAGQSPFHRDGDETLVPLMNRILTGEPRDLRPYGAPDQLCQVLSTAMAKESHGRPQSAEGFGRLLQDVQRQLGVTVTHMTASPLMAATSPIVAVPVDPVTQQHPAQPVGAAAPDESATVLRQPRPAEAVDGLIADVPFAPPPSDEAYVARDRPEPAIEVQDDTVRRDRFVEPEVDTVRRDALPSWHEEVQEDTVRRGTIPPVEARPSPAAIVLNPNEEGVKLLGEAARPVDDPLPTQAAELAEAPPPVPTEAAAPPPPAISPQAEKSAEDGETLRRDKVPSLRGKARAPGALVLNPNDEGVTLLGQPAPTVEPVAVPGRSPDGRRRPRAAAVVAGVVGLLAVIVVVAVVVLPSSKNSGTVHTSRSVPVSATVAPSTAPTTAAPTTVPPTTAPPTTVAPTTVPPTTAPPTTAKAVTPTTAYVPRTAYVPPATSPATAPHVTSPPAPPPTYCSPRLCGG